MTCSENVNIDYCPPWFLNLLMILPNASNLFCRPIYRRLIVCLPKASISLTGYHLEQKTPETSQLFPLWVLKKDAILAVSLTKASLCSERIAASLFPLWFLPYLFVSMKNSYCTLLMLANFRKKNSKTKHQKKSCSSSRLSILFD